MKRPLTIDQQRDMADSDMKFERMYREAQGDAWREGVRLRTKALFDFDPRCGICGGEIENVSVAMLWEPVDYPGFLVCPRAECQLKALNSSMTRYLKQNMNARHVPKEYRGVA